MTYPFAYCPACGKPEPSFCADKKLHCAACGLHYFHNVAAAVGVFIHYREYILFALRAREPAIGMLDLPGGFIEPEESLEQGLKREIKEELNIELPEPEYLFSVANHYPYRNVHYRTIDALFKVVFTQRPSVKAADDVAAIRWLKLTDIDLQDVAFASTRNAIVRLRHEQHTRTMIEPGST